MRSLISAIIPFMYGVSIAAFLAYFIVTGVLTSISVVFQSSFVRLKIWLAISLVSKGEVLSSIVSVVLSL